MKEIKTILLSLLNKKLGTLLMWPFSADFKGRVICLTCAFVLVGLPRPDMHHKSEKWKSIFYVFLILNIKFKASSPEKYLTSEGRNEFWSFTFLRLFCRKIQKEEILWKDESLALIIYIVICFWTQFNDMSLNNNNTPTLEIS